MQGGDALSNPNDLNAAQPVRYMADGGFIVPPQLPVVYRPEDRSYLEARQAEAEAYDAQRNAYNAALEKYKTEVYNPYESQLNAYNAAAQAYNRDVYEPYQAAYKRYEEAVNAFNAGPMDSEYAGPEAPTLRPFEMQAPVAPTAFSMTAPTMPFKEEEVSARQAQAAEAARQDAASRQFAFEAINDPRQFNLSAMSRGSGIAGLSVPGYMKGGPVIAKPPAVLTSKQMLRKLGNKTKKFEEGGPVITDRGDARQMLDEVPGYAFGGLIKKLARSVRERMEPQRIERAGVPEQSPVVATQPLSELNSQISALQKRLEGMPQQLSYQRRGPLGIGRRTVQYDNPEYMSAQTQLQALLKQRDAMPPSAAAPAKPVTPAAPVVPQPTIGTPAPTASSPIGALPIKEFMPPVVAPQPVSKSPTAAPVDPLAKMVLEMAVKRTEPNMMWDANGDGRISAADALQVAKGWRPKDYGQQPAFPKVYPDTFVGPLPKGSVRESDVVTPGPRPVAPQPVAPSPIVPSPITPPSVPGV